MIHLVLIRIFLTVSGIFDPSTHITKSLPSTSTPWYESLPACPCENPDKEKIVLGDGWAMDRGNLEKYHPGATVCFRSYPQVQTKFGPSGQQCCYDETGKLIGEGASAGSPDKVSPCFQENKDGVMKYRLGLLRKHYLLDVKPWNKLVKQYGAEAWKYYHQGWPPNSGSNCH